MVDVTLTDFRKRLFELADRTLLTGEPLTLLRKGRRLTLRADDAGPQARLSAYLEKAAAEDHAPMSDEDRRRFDLGDAVDAGDEDQPELYR